MGEKYCLDCISRVPLMARRCRYCHSESGVNVTGRLILTIIGIAIMLWVGKAYSAPSEAASSLQCGTRLLEQGKFSEAESVAKEQIRTADNTIPALMLLGRAKMGTGDFAGAISALKLALRHEPKHKDAKKYLTIARREYRRRQPYIERAVTHHAKARELWRHGVLEDDLASLRAAEKQYRLAAKAYEQFLARFGGGVFNEQEIRYSYGVTLFYSRQFLRAAKVFGGVQGKHAKEAASARKEALALAGSR